eukprot:239718-Rhodomonas_salina.2
MMQTPQPPQPPTTTVATPTSTKQNITIHSRSECKHGVMQERTRQGEAMSDSKRETCCCTSMTSNTACK